eukprot:TRINITY_DN30795_c0_g1_i1.p1 TRINITY_DN30795_c0_g1~~TRINITY_DN30795_c0_g1_i1.p1  ORF type:complete len:151 (-),score=12.41 TRINITY_DN30795_c0_g1_i1:301-753(-)
MTDGSVIVAHVFDNRQLVESYNRQHPESNLEVDDLENCIEGTPVHEWACSTLARFRTVRDGQRLCYAFQVVGEQKVFCFRALNGDGSRGPAGKFYIGFYTMCIRCCEGENWQLRRMDQFLLSDSERDTLAQAVRALDLSADQPLHVLINS